MEKSEIVAILERHFGPASIYGKAAVYGRVANEILLLQLPQTTILLPFDSPEFRLAWDEWKRYKSREGKGKYRSPKSEQVAINHLAKIANDNEQTAIDIINESIGNHYTGLFPLKISYLKPNEKRIDTPWRQ